MTTDIILRLRQTAESWQGTRPPDATIVHIFHEAADEIEKLRHSVLRMISEDLQRLLDAMRNRWVRK